MNRNVLLALAYYATIIFAGLFMFVVLNVIGTGDDLSDPISRLFFFGGTCIIVASVFAGLYFTWAKLLK
ncbi:MAG: hypothetical protein ABJA67_15060 [Chthonomonadales bacterium]